MDAVWPPPPTSPPPASAEASPSLVKPTLLYALVWSLGYVLFLLLGEGFHNTTFNGFEQPLRNSPAILLAYLVVTLITGILFGYNHAWWLSSRLKYHPVQGWPLVWCSVLIGTASGPLQVLLLAIGDVFNPLHFYPVMLGSIQTLDTSRLFPFAIATIVLAMSSGYVVGRGWPRIMGRLGYNIPMPDQDSRLSRRTFLKASSAALLVSVAGAPETARADDAGPVRLKNDLLEAEFDGRGLTALHDLALNQTINFGSDGFSVTLDQATLDSAQFPTPTRSQDKNTVTYRYAIRAAHRH